MIDKGRYGGIFLVLLLIFISAESAELPTLYEYFGEGGISQGLQTQGRNFTLNGKAIRLISGAIHYWRVHPSRWRDSMRKLRATGANTLETYIAWNLHEPQKNVFDFGQGQNDFSEFLNLTAFIQMAQEEDLLVLLRPGPYICSEYEFGGFPSWLLGDTNMRVRGTYAPFLERVSIYFRKLLEILQPLQFTKGGPVIGIQLENEYGNFRPIQRAYVEYLRDMYTSGGFNDTILYTADNAPKVDAGGISGMLKTINFGRNYDVVAQFELLLQTQPDKPIMAMELWTGWFDYWSYRHQTWDSDDFQLATELLLGPYGGSVNFYMFHGGTNFGFSNGGWRTNSVTSAVTTSYDYDAPLTEAGDYTEKYEIISRLAEKYAFPKLKTPERPLQQEKAAYGTISPQSYLSYDAILAQLPESNKFYKESIPTTMELLNLNNGSGQSYGYIIHRVYPQGGANVTQGSLFKAGLVRDMGSVVSDGKIQPSSFAGEGYSRYWTNSEREISLDVEPSKGVTYIDLVIENMGRENVGGGESNMRQYKGLLDPAKIWLDGQEQQLFDIFALEFKSAWVKSLSNFQLVTNLSNINAPALFKSTFNVSGEPRDTFLDLTDGWHKGIAFVNGFNIGRYFTPMGPQKRLYVPAPILKQGENTLVIFEQFEVGRDIRFESTPLLT